MMDKKIYFLFERSSKIGISQFILFFIVIFLTNLFEVDIQDNLQILLLGSSFFITFSLVSYDQTKIFGFKFRITGLLTSIVGLFCIYSPILLSYFQIINIDLWIILILFGILLVTLSIVSDYYLIGIPEIVYAINYLIKLLKNIPQSLKKVFKSIYISIPFIIFYIMINNDLTSEMLFVILLSIVIFIAGILNDFKKDQELLETIIRERSNVAIYSLSSFKWKIDSNITRYRCLSCNEPIQVTENVCIKCNSPINTCLICKLPFKDHTKNQSCEVCNYHFHKNHWDFWISYRGSCPNCKTEYSPVSS